MKNNGKESTKFTANPSVPQKPENEPSTSENLNSRDWSKMVEEDLGREESDKREKGNQLIDELTNSNNVSGISLETSDSNARDRSSLDPILPEQNRELNLNNFSEKESSNSENEPTAAHTSRKWANLFTQLRRDKATFSSFSPRGSTKNDNA
ncbi:2517_t:CDS:1, partial [Scutellospora calospora]